MDTPSDIPEYNWKDWKKQPWASRVTKKEEAILREEPSSKAAREMRVMRAWYAKDPKGFTDRMRQDYEQTIQELHKTMEAVKSDDPRVAQMQAVIDQMARASGKFKESPELIVLPSDSKFDWECASRDILNAGAEPGNFILLNAYSKQQLLENPALSRAIFAHEMGHLANKDLEFENALLAKIKPPSQKKELLADRMGAIIH
ncbi:MAG: M48 family metalloprotease, partial [Pseudomonadota bacterium]|nr:M48 family metalloprotease [Pseudomonadota bacterium]